jgi:hypothetical protein
MACELATPRVLFLERISGVDEAASSVVPAATDSPMFVGDGALNCVCPHCLRVLCESIARGDLAGVLIRCECGNLGCVPSEPSSAHHAKVHAPSIR